MQSILISKQHKSTLDQFLQDRDFLVEEIASGIYKVQREEELPVFVSIEGGQLFFEVDLGAVQDHASQDLFTQLLKLNTEILPVSVAIDDASAEDERLVLVESREIGDLSDVEVLSVFDSLAIAVDKTEVLLSQYFKGQ